MDPRNEVPTLINSQCESHASQPVSARKKKRDNKHQDPRNQFVMRLDSVLIG